MSIIETEAIVLRTFKLAESDKIVVVLSRNAGVVRGVARGSRKLKSKFGASLEPFTVIRLTFFEKETRELVSFSNTEIISSNFGLMVQGDIFLALEYLAGLILEFAPLRDPDERYYRMVKACLETLADNSTQLELVTCYFELWILKLAGFLPDILRCSQCKREFTTADSQCHLIPSGALKCSKCTTAGGVVISGEGLCCLINALKVSPKNWVARSGRVFESRKAEMSRMIHVLIARALEREPKSRLSRHTNNF